MRESYPLSYGQLSVLRALTGLPRTTAVTNLGEVFELAAPVAPDQVMDALEGLVERHESLRTTYVLSGSSAPAQVVADHIELPVDTTELADRSPEGHADALDRLVAVAHDVEHRAGWNASVLTRGGTAVAVAFAMHHIVGDAWAAGIIDGDLRALAADPRASLGPAPTPRQLAVEQRGPAWAAARRAFEEHWEPLLADPARLPTVDAPPIGPGPRLIASLTLAHSRVDVADLARGYDAIPAAVLLSLVVIAVSQTRECPDLCATIMVANRFDPRWDRLVSTMNQIVPVSLQPVAGEVFSDLVLRVQDAMADAALAGCYDVDEVADRLAARGGPVGLDYWVNYQVESAGGASPAGNRDGTVRWEEHPCRMGPRFYIRVSAGDALALEVLIVPGFLPRVSVERLLRGMNEALAMLRAQRKARVDALLSCFR